MFLHASRSLEYRNPFGAQPVDSGVNIVFDTPLDAQNVTLCYTYGLYGMTYHEEPMCLKDKKTDHKRYEVDIMLPHEPGLLFYWFRLRLPRGSQYFPTEYYDVTSGDYEDYTILYYVAEGDTKDGSGKLFNVPPKVGVEEEKYPYAWQITVYEKDFVTPDKMKGASIYQIFPDRFARDKNFKFTNLITASPREERVYHEDWYEDVDIYGKPSTGYLACDFFGGSLRGITERLDYIKSLGINIIYLNPIFEARSSHRYDTADYLQVDPILGGNEAFDELQKACQEKGISIIIDGVFSHTGADSRYFNKFDRYDGVGAYKSYLTGEESNYRSWYNFYHDENGKVTYDSWWGFPDLPNVDENNLSYRRFIFGEGGVVDTWTKRGAGGIRLDVSDELPDGFIRQMRDTLKADTNGEGILVGEVWEDASNKCSYGSYRDFMLGRTHDSVMGYTFRKEILDFLCGYTSAEVLDSRLEGYRERYPAQAYYSIMNLVSSHDVPRILTMLSKPADYDNREQQKSIVVPDENYDECAKLSTMAYALQTGYIGASCLYYGDEILMEGYKDPFNRRTYPWEKLEKKQKDHLEVIKSIAALRGEHDVLKTGCYKTLLANEGSFVFERYLVKGKDFFGKDAKGSSRIVCIINRSNKVHTYKIDNTANVKCTELVTSIKTTKNPVVHVDSGVKSTKLSIEHNGCCFVIFD
ncbi:MAG: glycoside hydrolase family 13 protein [Saccharofermentans sp.]|nr:glycoside hydrolase family 13 protein [Saccharofermentans sp.]